MLTNKKLKCGIVILLMLLACGCSNKVEEEKVSITPSFDFLNRITLEELDRSISQKENLFLYFGWVDNSSECIKVQENYLEKYIDYYQWNGLITVVDLDQQLPQALHDKKLRETLTEKYNIRYAPAFVMVKFGKIESFIEWTPEANDLNDGMNIESLNEWFSEVGLLS